MRVHRARPRVGRWRGFDPCQVPERGSTGAVRTARACSGGTSEAARCAAARPRAAVASASRQQSGAALGAIVARDETAAAAAAGLRNRLHVVASLIARAAQLVRLPHTRDEAAARKQPSGGRPTVGRLPREGCEPMSLEPPGRRDARVRDRRDGVRCQWWAGHERVTPCTGESGACARSAGSRALLTRAVGSRER